LTRDYLPQMNVTHDNRLLHPHNNGRHLFLKLKRFSKSSFFLSITRSNKLPTARIEE
jgi:hypothetical protein